MAKADDERENSAQAAQDDACDIGAELTLGCRLSRNVAAKITPEKKIGTKTTPHDAATFVIPGRLKNVLIGT